MSNDEIKSLIESMQATIIECSNRIKILREELLAMQKAKNEDSIPH